MSKEFIILHFFLSFSFFGFTQNDSTEVTLIEIEKGKYDSLSLKAQSLPSGEIEKYYDHILNLKRNEKLTSVTYPEMSYCGGQLIGYFLKNELVLMEAKIKIEFSVENYICIIDKQNPLKIIQHQKIFKNDRFKEIEFEKKTELILTNPIKLYVDDNLLSGKELKNEIEKLNKCYNIRLEEIKSAAANSKYSP